MMNLASYTYDANGLRTSKTVNGFTCSHVWDGMNMVKDGDTYYYYGLDLISNSLGDYYVHDGHGDVIGLTDSTNNMPKKYAYDAFGTEYNADQTDQNPFRYCGEYYDNELDSIYLRARYYEPSTGRFTTVDPIKDGLNWYTYCASNPISYTDPSGLKMNITDNRNKDILKNLSLLTDDELYIKNGEVNYKKATTVNNSEGTKLIRSIIDNKEYTVDISLTSGNNKTNPENDYGRSSSKISFNPSKKDTALTIDRYGEIKSEKIPAYIALGHELIHAHSNMTGKSTYSNTEISYNVRNKQHMAKPDEALTTGLRIPYETKKMLRDNLPITTENDLRAEHGLNLRIIY